MLSLKELKRLVEEDHDLQWGMDPRGMIQIKNSDGTTSAMQPREGFMFRNSQGFYMCYEFFQGIARHPDDNQRVIDKARAFAARLGATFFLV